MHQQFNQKTKSCKINCITTQVTFNRFTTYEWKSNGAIQRSGEIQTLQKDHIPTSIFLQT